MNDSSSDLTQESRSQGKISLRSYLNFFKAGGGILLLAVTIAILVLGEVCMHYAAHGIIMSIHLSLIGWNSGIRLVVI